MNHHNYIIKLEWLSSRNKVVVYYKFIERTQVIIYNWSNNSPRVVYVPTLYIIPQN